MAATDHPTHAVIYCRVSTADQSCERQERDLRAYAHRAGIMGLEKSTMCGYNRTTLTHEGCHGRR